MNDCYVYRPIREETTFGQTAPACEYCGDTGLCGYDPNPQLCAMCPAGDRELARAAIAVGPTARRLIFGPDRNGDAPTREKVLERALEQIEGKASLACDVLGPDNPGGRSWGLIVNICRMARDYASADTHPQGGDAVAAPFMSGAVASAQPTTDAQPIAQPPPSNEPEHD